MAATTLGELARSPTALKAAVAALPNLGGGVGASSSSSDYGTYLSTELPEYFDVVVREFWSLANECFLYMTKQNLESKGYFKKKTFQGAVKNPGMLKHFLQYELIQNPENAELKPMYQFQCEDGSLKPSQELDIKSCIQPLNSDDDAPLVFNLRNHAPHPEIERIKNVMQNFGASSSSTLRSASLPCMGGLDLESRNNSGNTAENCSGGN